MSAKEIMEVPLAWTDKVVSRIQHVRAARAAEWDYRTHAVAHALREARTLVKALEEIQKAPDGEPGLSATRVEHALSAVTRAFESIGRAEADALKAHEHHKGLVTAARMLGVNVDVLEDGDGED